MPKSNIDVLRMAALIIKKQGHAKHYLVDNRNHVCLAGAINQALTGDPMKWPTRTRRLINLIGEYIGDIDPVAWNNAAKRRPSEVIAALRGTAKQIAR